MSVQKLLVVLIVLCIYFLKGDKMRIKETKVYPFAELSETAKEKAIENLASINVDYVWWEFMLEDAKNVGIEIVEFDIFRASYCRGTIDDAIDTARAILKEHGNTCETWQTAKDFYDVVAKDGENTDNYESLCSEFEYSILEDYRILLQKEYENLTSQQVIIETIEINEYEFTENGELA